MSVRQNLFDLADVFDSSSILVRNEVTERWNEGEWELADESKKLIADALRAYAPPEQLS